MMINRLLEFKKDFVLIIIGIISLILSYLGFNVYGVDLAWISILTCGLPLVYRSITALIKEKDIKADVLVSIAIIASILIGEVFAAGEIAVIMVIGGLLEEITVSTTQVRLETLMDLQPPTARKIQEDTETIINALEVKEDDLIKILPGETIPADGIIISGSTTVNQSIITGESKPIDKTINDEVFAGTINNYGTITIKSTADGENNSLQKLINMIESLNTEDSKIIRQADKWANWIVILSFSISILTLIFTHNILNAVTVLVVFCPCALILATPTAIVAAIGNLSKHGILVKNARVVENLHKSDTIFFDKTGTLTTGIPKVVDVFSFSGDTEELLDITASIESYSEHPLAKTIMDYYNSTDTKKKLMEFEDFNIELGLGVRGVTNNKECIVGNSRLFKKLEIDLPLIDYNEKISGSTVLYTYYDNKFLGYIVIKDTPRKNMKSLINSLYTNKYDLVLLTGDNKQTSTDIASQLNISKVQYNCLPENKLDTVTDYQKRLHKVIMIGDGINDASAMKKADVGIAMGDVGSDITIDSSDIVFMNDNMDLLPYLLKMSKKTLSTINIGISFSLILNTIAVLLAVIGVLTPITGALVHNIGSVLVIICAVLLFSQNPEKLTTYDVN